MEMISSFSSTPFYGSLKKYWKRRRYQRLHSEITSKKNVKIARFGGNNNRRFWKIRAIPKLRLKIVSPIKLLAKLRDAYVDMMLGLAGNSGNVFGGKRIPKAREVPMVITSEECERKLLFEIYRVLVASRELPAF